MSDPTRPPDDSGVPSDGPPPPPSDQPGYQPPTHPSGASAASAPGGYGPGPSPTNALAIAALVVGILSIPAIFTVIFGIVLGIAAIVLGILGLSKSKQLHGSGRGLAIGGIVTGVIGLLLSLLIIGGLFALGGAVSDGAITIDGTEFEIPTE